MQQHNDIVSGLSFKLPWWAHTWQSIGIILGAIGIIYGRVLGFEFVTYDDYDMIYNNASYLGKIGNIADAFRTPGLNVGHGTQMYYRPIQVISHILDYQVWGLHPFGFHLTSLLLHALTTLLLYQLLRLIIDDRRWSLIVTLLFALHPVQTEAVAWISGRVDVLLAFFMVSMMFFYVRSRMNIGHNRMNVALTILSFVAAVFSKEPAIPYLLLIPLYEIGCGDGKFRRVFTRQNIGLFFVMGIIILMYGIMRVNIFGDVISATNTVGLSQTIQRLGLVPAVLAEHLALLCAPVRLSVAHPLNDLIWMQSPWSFIAVAISLLIMAGLWVSWKKDRLLFFGLGWLTMTLLPMLNIIPIAVPVMEHRLYLPMVGFAIVVTRGIVLFLKTFRLEKLGTLVLWGVIVAYAVISSFRLPVWTNSAMLWEDAIQKAPTYGRSYLNLAGYYYEHQQYDRTIELMKTYVRLNPNDEMGLIKLRQSNYAAGRLFDAARVSRLLIPSHRLNSTSYIETAELFMEAGAPDSAVAVYAEGITALPGDYLLHHMLGRVYSRTRNDTLAERQYRRTLELNPRYGFAYFDLGILYATEGDQANALRELEEGLKFESPTEDVLPLLHRLYLDAGEKEKAEALRRKYNF